MVLPVNKAPSGSGVRSEKERFYLDRKGKNAYRVLIALSGEL